MELTDACRLPLLTAAARSDLTLVSTSAEEADVDEAYCAEKHFAHRLTALSGIRKYKILVICRGTNTSTSRWKMEKQGKANELEYNS